MECSKIFSCSIKYLYGVFYTLKKIISWLIICFYNYWDLGIKVEQLSRRHSLNSFDNSEVLG